MPHQSGIKIIKTIKQYMQDNSKGKGITLQNQKNISNQLLYVQMLWIDLKKKKSCRREHLQKTLGMVGMTG